jgi:hypothetical protein
MLERDDSWVAVSALLEMLEAERLSRFVSQARTWPVA